MKRLPSEGRRGEKPNGSSNGTLDLVGEKSGRRRRGHHLEAECGLSVKSGKQRREEERGCAHL